MPSTVGAGIPNTFWIWMVGICSVFQWCSGSNGWQNGGHLVVWQIGKQKLETFSIPMCLLFQFSVFKPHCIRFVTVLPNHFKMIVNLSTVTTPQRVNSNMANLIKLQSSIRILDWYVFYRRVKQRFSLFWNSVTEASKLYPNSRLWNLLNVSTTKLLQFFYKI